jgi:hypothetical protein
MIKYVFREREFPEQSLVSGRFSLVSRRFSLKRGSFQNRAGLPASPVVKK